MAAATDMTGSLTLNISGSYTLGDSLAGDALKNLIKTLRWPFTFGTGGFQTDLFYNTGGSLNTGGTTYDLAGSLTDVYGNTLTFAEISFMLFLNKSTSGNLLVGPTGSNQFAPMFNGASNGLIVYPGATDSSGTVIPGVALIGTPNSGGYAVTAGTGDNLKLAASTGTITFEMWLFGRSA